MNRRSRIVGSQSRVELAGIDAESVGECLRDPAWMGVDEGGMTDFTRVALSIPPCAGTMLLWNNALPDGTPNPWTMHAARPVVRGVKYVVTKWFRTRTWQ
jgi:hypothetical protein